MTELEAQPVPSDSKCPYCGSEPTDESQLEHKLSNLGYHHDDVLMVCSNDDCGGEWPCGVPIGEYDGGDDLFCESCESRFMRLHRIDVSPYVAGKDHVDVHLKCPNQSCFFFKTIERNPGPKGVALIGYPDITGEVEGAETYGYSEDEGRPSDQGE